MTRSEKDPKLEAKYRKCKQRLDLLRDDITLKRWKILSEAYKLGKKIWGNGFTVQRLAEDMEIPYTTCKRCLALDRCNKRTWKLIKEKKISVFKVAMICSEKNKTYQDEIVDAVIEDGLSTYDISSLKIDGIKDVNKERHRLAVEKGYSRQDSAAYNLDVWIDRGHQFLLLDKEQLPQSKIISIKKKLLDLSEKIKKYAEELDD